MFNFTQIALITRILNFKLVYIAKSDHLNVMTMMVELFVGCELRTSNTAS